MPSDVGGSPGGLLILAAAVAGVGGIFIAIANLIKRTLGDDMNTHAEEDARRYRHMSDAEQFVDFHSNPLNFHVMLGIFGFLLCAFGILLAIGAGVWFLRMHVF